MFWSKGVGSRPMFSERRIRRDGLSTDWIPSVREKDSMGNVVFADKHLNLVVIVIGAGKKRTSYIHDYFKASPNETMVGFSDAEGTYEVKIERGSDTLMVFPSPLRV